MKKVSEYQEHADECRRLAASTLNEEHRAALQSMAETWESLADDRAERILREARIEALEHPPAESAA
jgi:hypothetical protein